MSTVATTCPFCACGCGFYLESRQGQLVGVAPGESHPVSEGRLCARGWNAHEATLWGDRLKQPLLLRKGKQESVSWAEALDYTADRLKQLISVGKPVGVLGSSRATNEENYLAGKLARAGFHTNNVDFSYHPIARSLLLGLQEVCGGQVPSVRFSDIKSSEVILLVEGNLAETHPQVASAVMTALEKGARLIVISHRRTQMTRLASLHLQSMPGSEGEGIFSLLAAVLNLESERQASAVINCEGLRSDLQGVKGTEEQRQAADWIAHAKRATFLIPPNWGRGNQLRKEAAVFANLAAVTGHLGRSGSGILPLLARSNVRGACDMGVVPDRLPGYEPLDNLRSQQRVQSLWGRELPSVGGRDIESLLQSVSGLIVMADNPASVLPMGQRAIAAMKAIDFLVVLDAFNTPAVRIAHAQLPIASFAETDGTVTNLEGRVQRLHAAASPPGEARAGWRVLAELCARFGMPGSYSSVCDVLHEVGQAVPRYAGAEWTLTQDAWGGVLLDDLDGAKVAIGSIGAVEMPSSTTAERTFLLALDGTFDWGDDPLVSFSPTLCRGYRSEGKLFPAGVVELGQSDADVLKLRPGRQVRLTSAHGEAVVPVRIRTDVKSGLLFVPYNFRDCVANVLGSGSVTAIKVECA